MIKQFIASALLVVFTLSVKSQSINVGGVFPTIDHSGTISNKLDYSLYYFAAFPLVNFDKPNLSQITQ